MAASAAALRRCSPCGRPPGPPLLLLVLLLVLAVDAHDRSYVTSSSSIPSESLLCRRCGHAVSDALKLINVPSSMALGSWNYTVLGVPQVLVQHFGNSAGMHFDVLTCRDADVKDSLESYDTDTWFPGYSWKISVCGKCGGHLGWRYVAQRPGAAALGGDSFVGLVLPYLVHEDFAATLVASPRLYRS